jgi:hypothetical protein
MPIYKYLRKIKNGELINYDAFIKLLEAEGFAREEIHQSFSVNKISKTQYQITVTNEERFNTLTTKFPERSISDRISAAEAGNSHRHPVSKAMLILWPYQADHPVVVFNNSEQVNSPVTLSKNLLVMENQENFVQKERTLNFLMREIPGFNDKQLDVAFASGNAITNRLNKAFFNHYSRIDCLLDLDIGGLEIFESLANLTQHPALNFLLPACAENLLLDFGIKLEDHHLPRLRKLDASCPKLKAPIRLIVENLKMLEQELYLRN